MALRVLSNAAGFGRMLPTIGHSYASAFVSPILVGRPPHMATLRAALDAFHGAACASVRQSCPCERPAGSLHAVAAAVAIRSLSDAVALQCTSDADSRRSRYVSSLDISLNQAALPRCRLTGVA
jgi:hypothetical protein